MINAGVPTNLLETANEEERGGGKKHRNERAVFSKGSCQVRSQTRQKLCKPEGLGTSTQTATGQAKMGNLCGLKSVAR